MKLSIPSILFIEKHFNFPILKVVLIAESGSNRKYYRIWIENETYIITENNFIEENNTFIYLSKLFNTNKILVPKLLAYNESKTTYIQQDIGDVSILNVIQNEGYTVKVKGILKQSLQQLIQLKLNIKDKIDYTQCYDFLRFDDKVVYNDLFYFKNYFLDRLDIPYKKSQLIDDIEKIAKEITILPANYFLYRDFQSRNIFIAKNKIYFIDFQGGMKGFLGYDLVSFLWQAKAQLPIEWKDELKNYYFNECISHKMSNIAPLEKGYKLSLILRFFQLMGAYGLRGLVEKKPHFLDSILLNINNIEYLLHQNILDPYAEFKKIATILTSAEGKNKIKEFIEKIE